ncbi:hypothetical protein ACHWQZ_G001150 [Mnemiopsis leidyi]
MKVTLAVGLIVVMVAVFVQQTEGISSAGRKHRAFGLSEEEVELEFEKRSLDESREDSLDSVYQQLQDDLEK